MKITILKCGIGAAIIISLLAGTALADGNRGRRHGGSGPGYHQPYRQHHGPDYRRPAPHRGHQHFGPGYHHRPRHHRGPEHRHGYAYKEYRHPRHPAYRGHAYHGGSGLHLSVYDPYFTFGFSTGGRW